MRFFFSTVKLEHLPYLHAFLFLEYSERRLNWKLFSEISNALDMYLALFPTNRRSVLRKDYLVVIAKLLLCCFLFFYLLHCLPWLQIFFFQIQKLQKNMALLSFCCFFAVAIEVCTPLQLISITEVIGGQKFSKFSFLSCSVKLSCCVVLTDFFLGGNQFKGQIKKCVFFKKDRKKAF